MCIFHKYIRVEDVDHSGCGRCFRTPAEIDAKLVAEYPKGYCPHSFKVCKRCGKAVGYGSHGKLTLIPDGCKEQIIKNGWKASIKKPYEKFEEAGQFKQPIKLLLPLSKIIRYFKSKPKKKVEDEREVKTLWDRWRFKG